MNTWNLDILYTSYEDERFTADFTKMIHIFENFSTYVETLDSQSIEDIITYLEELQELSAKLYGYLNLRITTNTIDPTSSKYMNQLQMAHAKAAKAEKIIDKYLAEKVNIDTLEQDHPTLVHYKFYFSELKKQIKHLLSNDVEDVVAKLNVSGGNGYENLHDYLTSTLEVNYLDEIITLPAVRNLAYSSDAAVRKAGYEAELTAYDKIKGPVSFALNNIKAEVLTLCQLRGYESVLDMTLEHSNMSKSTLDAMIEAIEEYLPKFHLYLQTKAKILGHEGSLPWYDLFAPFESTSKSYTIEEARTILVENFSTFSPDLATLVERSFDEQWIDFDPRSGKVGGAYCHNLGMVKQSRILTNYDGSLSDIVTLAHELGHAYHGMHIENHAPLNRDYSMPVAETASTFNENIILNAMIQKADKETKIALIESQLQDLTQIICDIYSRFKFESAVFANRSDHFMFDTELCEMMLNAQKEAYGEGLDSSTLHPYMWVNKGHYYSSHLSFYNFPYAFGGLFARGLYATYKVEGEAFVERYQALLHATTINTAEDVAAICGIDLRDSSFWKSALQQVSILIDEFIELTA